MPHIIDNTDIIDLLSKNTNNLFYTDIIHQLENIVPDKLQSIINTILQLISTKKLNRLVLDELNKSSAQLSKSYYNEYIYDTLPYHIYYISSRIAMDIQRLILQIQKNK